MGTFMGLGLSLHVIFGASWFLDLVFGPEEEENIIKGSFSIGIHWKSQPRRRALRDEIVPVFVGWAFEPCSKYVQGKNQQPMNENG